MDCSSRDEVNTNACTSVIENTAFLRIIPKGFALTCDLLCGSPAAVGLWLVCVCVYVCMWVQTVHRH